MKVFLAAIALLLASIQPLWAADSLIGTWIPRKQQTAPGMTGSMTLVVEPYGAEGRKFTWHIKMNDKESLMVVESPMNGTEATVMVDGKPTGETMAIKRVDDRHSFTVIKMGGKPFGTSKGELSADGKMLTVENEFTQATPNSSGKATEIWDRK